MDVAEAFRDLPGLAVLESARPGRRSRWSYVTADPIAVLDATELTAPIRSPPPGGSSRDWPPIRSKPAHGAEATADRAAVPRRSRRLHRLRRRPRPVAAADRRDRRPGAAAPPARPARLGRGLGSSDRRRLARRSGRRWRPGGARTATRRRPRAPGCAGGRAHRRPPWPEDADGRDVRRAARVRIEPVAGDIRAGRRGGSRRDRPRSHLPGEPHPSSRDSVPVRSVAAVSLPPDRRPGALLRLPRPRARRPRPGAAGHRLRLPGAVPRRSTPPAT